jgi:hypothetical protein
MKYSILLLALSAALSFIKRSRAENPFGTKYWLVSSSTISPAVDLNLDGKLDTDVLSVAPKCEIDDALRFDEEGVLTIHRGKNRCYEEEEEEGAGGSWTYESKILTLDYDDSRRPVKMTVLEISSQRIVTSSVLENGKTKHTIRTVLTSR